MCKERESPEEQEQSSNERCDLKNKNLKNIKTMSVLPDEVAPEPQLLWSPRAEEEIEIELTAQELNG